MAKLADASTLPTHGAANLPAVTVDSYNLEMEDQDGFVGDKASKGAFKDIVEQMREPLRNLGDDPLGETPTEEITKKQLDVVLAKGSPEAAGLVQGAIELFAGQLSMVIRRFLKAKAWHGTECIVVGGGFRARRVGEIAIGRCGVLLKSEGVDVDLQLIRHDPDEAGLIGALQLLPPWMLTGYEGILAVDIGGTNIRAGIVQTNHDKATDFSEACVVESEVWRHTDDSDVDRDEAVSRIDSMLRKLIKDAKKSRLELAPVIGVGCPGVIDASGQIVRGTQNLPGNWESESFNLPGLLRERIPSVGDHETLVVMHNDAVVQGLSQLPFVTGRLHWGVLTIGTGLGNARFTSKRP